MLKKLLTSIEDIARAQLTGTLLIKLDNVWFSAIEKSVTYASRDRLILDMRTVKVEDYDFILAYLKTGEDYVLWLIPTDDVADNKTISMDKKDHYKIASATETFTPYNEEELKKLEWLSGTKTIELPKTSALQQMREVVKEETLEDMLNLLERNNDDKI